jgi:hypothetical protein
MRRLLALAVASSGCLFSAPEGAPQYWPPQLGGTVQAVSSGDLDGNGSTEVIVYMTGNSSQAGLYELVGGQDFTSGGRSPVTSFSKFVPSKLAAPTAAFQVGGGTPRVYVATGSDPVELTAYSNLVEEDDVEITDVSGGSALLWVRPIMFPGNMLHIAVSNGSLISHISSEFLDEQPIPAPSSQTWDLAQLTTSYASGMDLIAVVATPTQIVRSPLPAQANLPFTWTTVRSGPAWVGQTSVDLDGDGREEIVGLDLAGKQLCVVDPGATAVPVTPVCLAIPILSAGAEATLLVGTNVTMNPGPDIVIAQATGSETQYTLVEDYTYGAGALTSSMIRTIPFVGPAHGRTVIINAGPGTPNQVIVFGTDAASSCVQGPC